MKKTIYAILVLCLLLALVGCQAACEHTYTEEITAQASCSQVGTKTFTCTLCGDSYTEEIPMLAHTFGKETVSKPATCTEKGEKSATCTVCGATEVTGTISTIDHPYDDGVITKEATCTAEGEKVYTCTACDDKYTVPVKKTSHNYVSKVTTAATCTKEGVETLTCSICKDSYTKSISKAKHNYSSKVTTAATCTKAGVKTYTCSDCKDTYTESIAKAKHNYTSKVTTAATCTKAGVKTYTCSACKDTYTEKIAAKGHNYTSKTTAAATCTNAGSKTYTCSDCGNSYKETISAKGHKWVDATCTKAKYCSNCKTTSGSALGHDYKSGDNCSRCGAAPSVTFIFPSTPATYSDYDSLYRKNTSCEITGISASLNYVSYDGTVDYEVLISGTCTYNREGNSVSTRMRFGYKLYDADGIVVDSGSVSTESVAVGEKFRDDISFWNLTPGETYTLVLLDSK